MIPFYGTLTIIPYMVSDLPHEFLPLPWKTSKLPLRFSERIRWEMGAEQERESGCLDQDANLGFSLHCWFFFFFCKSGLFQRQTYVQPIRGWFERGWRRRDSFVSLRYYNLLTPIVHFWRVSVACQASLVEPFVFWQDMVEPKCLPRDQTSLICRQSVREGCE